MPPTQRHFFNQNDNKNMYKSVAAMYAPLFDVRRRERARDAFKYPMKDQRKDADSFCKNVPFYVIDVQSTAEKEANNGNTTIKRRFPGFTAVLLHSIYVKLLKSSSHLYC